MSERQMLVTITKGRDVAAMGAITTTHADVMLKLLEQPREAYVEQANRIGVGLLEMRNCLRPTDAVSVSYLTPAGVVVSSETLPVRAAMIYAAAVRLSVMQDTDSGLENLKSDLRRFLMGIDIKTCVPFLPTIGILPK